MAPTSMFAKNTEARYELACAVLLCSVTSVSATCVSATCVFSLVSRFSRHSMCSFLYHEGQ